MIFQDWLVPMLWHCYMKKPATYKTVLTARGKHKNSMMIEMKPNQQNSQHATIDQYASYPDWRISPHADPAISAQSHEQSIRCALPKFLTFWPSGQPLGQSSSKQRWPATHRDLPTCQIASPCVNPRQRYMLQNICKQTKKEKKKETVKDDYWHLRTGSVCAHKIIKNTQIHVECNLNHALTSWDQTSIFYRSDPSTNRVKALKEVGNQRTRTAQHQSHDKPVNWKLAAHCRTDSSSEAIVSCIIDCISSCCFSATLINDR